MKPFDLEAAKRSEAIVTRDGKPAKFVAHLPEANEDEQLICTVGRDVMTFYVNGVFLDSRQSPWDLFMAEKKKTYVNVYNDVIRTRKDGYPVYIGFGYHTQEMADAAAFLTRLACVEIEE